jgi:hypothetical protein
VRDQIERAYTEHNIASKHLEDDLKNAATEAEAEAPPAKPAAPPSLINVVLTHLEDHDPDSSP